MKKFQISPGLNKSRKWYGLAKHAKYANSNKATSPKKRSVLLRIVRIVVMPMLMLYLVCAVVLPFYICTVQNRTVNSNISPANYGMFFSDVSFPATVDQTTIRGWYMPGTNGRAILAVHGKEANRTTFLEKIPPLVTQGYSLLLIDLRGHGKSDGQWHSLGYYEQRDVLGAIDYLKEKGFSGSQIGILSESLGASVSLIVLGQTDIKTVVADSPFARLSTVLEDVTSGTALGPLLPSMLVSASLIRGIDINQVIPENAAKNINGRRVFLIAGGLDTLIPVKHHYRLKAAFGEAADSWLVPAADHVGAFNEQPGEYLAKVSHFFDKQLQPIIK